VRLLGSLSPIALAALVAVLAAGAQSDPPASSAAALVVQVTIPGAGTFSSAVVGAPPNASSADGAFAYPADGSVVRIGTGSSAAVVQSGTSASAQATAQALAVSLFAGEVVADAVDLRATAAAGAVNATGDASASTIAGLAVLGQPLVAAANGQVSVGDWGTLQVLSSSTEATVDAPRSARVTVAGLRLRLLADHASLPVGSEIVVGSASAVAAATPLPTAAPPSQRPGSRATPSPAPGPGQGAPPAAGRREGRVERGVPPGLRPRPRPNIGLDPGTTIPGRPPELVRLAPQVTARLTAGGYVFPIYGPASHGDTFGAPRGDVSGGWHHGEDIFAPEGSPVLAVADGTVFSVGWNRLGGWRLWLRDNEQNEFYYAHLSAYSPLAVDGQRVRAGDVLGFVGNTGRTSAMHLHFEIHPRELLSLGYDGAIAPYPFLIAWRRAEDVSFDAGRRFVGVSPRDGLPRSTVPGAGAVLLQADDISRASGLVPGALERALDGAKADEARLVPRSG
jgi:murein DD-endopeptidase MepM/ murein hydrolase activator NlpD